MAAAQKVRDAATTLPKSGPIRDGRLRPSSAAASAPKAADRYREVDFAFDEPQIQRYPPIVRLAVIGGTSTLFWVGVIMAAKSALRL